MVLFRTGGSNDFGSFFKITPAGVFTRLYDPKGEIAGSNPVGLTMGGDGNFYGAAQFGGTNGHGALFRWTNGAYANLYNFTGNSDGANPDTQLLSNNGYNLYGANPIGGDNGGGVIFNLALLHFNPPLRNGNQLIFGGAGGIAGAGYTLVSSTNPATPPNLWGTAGTGFFDATGTFGITNNINLKEKVRFYLLREP